MVKEKQTLKRKIETEENEKEDKEKGIKKNL